MGRMNYYPQQQQQQQQAQQHSSSLGHYPYYGAAAAGMQQQQQQGMTTAHYAPPQQHYGYYPSSSASVSASPYYQPSAMHIQPPVAAHYPNMMTASHHQHPSPPRSQSLSTEEDLRIKGTSQRYMVMQKLLRDDSATPSNCLLLNNMVGPGGEKDPQLQNEVTTECGKFGLVEKVVIYALPTAVKIFVLFRDLESAHRAKTSLDKRWFGGRLVEAQYYSTEKFNRGQYQ